MLIDQLFPNDVVAESAYGAVAGVETIRQLIQSVKNSQDIDLKVGPEQFPVRYDEARYLLSLWKANKEGGDKTAELFGNVNWIQDKLEDRDYRMGPGKLKDIDQERAKEIQKDRVLDLESKERTDEILPAIAGALGRAAVGALASTAVDSIKKKLSDTDMEENDCHCDHSYNKKRKDKSVEEGVEDSDVPPATRDYITKVIAGKIKPGLDPDGSEFEDEAYLYHTSELGRRDLMAKGGNWKAYYDAIKWWYKNTNESVEEGLMLPPKMEYKGWTYAKDVEEYEDNRKIFHSATKDGKEVSMDWSPYSTPTEKEFKLWIDLGMPTRKDVNSIGPLDNDDLMALAKTKRGTAGLLQQEAKDDDEGLDQSKLDAKTKMLLKKAKVQYGAQAKGDPLASLTQYVAQADSDLNQDVDRLDKENDREEADIAAQAVVDKTHDKEIGNNSLKDRYQDQEIDRLKQDLQKLLAR